MSKKNGVGFMNVGFRFQDDTVPMTEYWAGFRQAVRARPDFTETPGPRDLAFPSEDIAFETNWPRYGRQDEAFVRGAFSNDAFNDYMEQIYDCESLICTVNMAAYVLKQEYFVGNRNIIAADVSLTAQDRALNPRTISMAASPLVTGTFDISHKKRLASFRGAGNHPVRKAMASLAGVPGFSCEITDGKTHSGTIDAASGMIDASYYELLDESIFALVPRGFEHFSYRLLEAMSFGCIPIILSDDWILPFDRTIPWREFALHIPEAACGQIPDLIAKLSPETIYALQNKVAQVYQRYLKSLDAIVDTLIGEAALIVASGLTVPAPLGG